MADLTIKYKDQPIVELSESGTKTLKTGGKYCEGDISVEYAKTAGGGGGWEVIADQTLDTEAASVSFNFDVNYRRLWFAIYGVPVSGSNANLDVKFDNINLKRIQLPNGVPGFNKSDAENKRGTQIYLEKINGGFAFILCSVNNGSVFPHTTMFSPTFDTQKVDWSDISKVAFCATGTSFSAGSIFKLWGCK